MLSSPVRRYSFQLYRVGGAKTLADEGRQRADFAALEWCMASGFRTSRIALPNLANRAEPVVA